MCRLLLAIALAGAGPRDYAGPTAVDLPRAAAAPVPETPLESSAAPAPAPAPADTPKPKPELPKVEGIAFMVFGSAMTLGGGVIWGLSMSGGDSASPGALIVGMGLAGVGSHVLALGILLKVRHSRIKRRLQAEQTARRALRLHPTILERGAGLGLTLNL